MKSKYIGITFPIMQSTESPDGLIWKFRVYIIDENGFDYYQNVFEYLGKRSCKKTMKKLIRVLKRNVKEKRRWIKD